MKILQIIYSLRVGGAERFVVDLSNELSRQGHEVTLCILSDDSIGNFGFYKSEISQNISYINLKIPVGFRLSNILVLRKVIKRVNPQIVHCHLNLVNYIFPLTLVFPKIKFFHTIHSDAVKEVSNRVEYWIRRFFYANFKMKAITISAETSRSFTLFYKITPFKEIYNGRLKPEQSAVFFDTKIEIQKYRSEGNTVFVHVGTCTSVKNQEMLINVFNKVNQDIEPVVLLIIGSGFDSEEGEKLKNLACKKILFLGEKHNVSDYLLNADAFCLSSMYEGMPLSLIEAFACGCIPICTPVGGIINTIKNGKTGYISKSVSENDYFQSVLNYLGNKDQVKREDLIQFYLSRFSIEKCTKNYLLLYQ